MAALDHSVTIGHDRIHALGNDTATIRAAAEQVDECILKTRFSTFQAGAMLAAAMILLQLAYPSVHQGFNLYLLRLLLVIGIFTFVLVGLWMMFLNDDFLAYSPAQADSLILIIETAATLSIAAALTLAYLGGRPAGWENGLNKNESQNHTHTDNGERK